MHVMPFMRPRGGLARILCAAGCAFASARAAEPSAPTPVASAEALDPEAAFAYDFDRVWLLDGVGVWGKVQLPVTPDGWAVSLEDPRTEDPAERAVQRHTRNVVFPVGRVRDIAWSVQRRESMLRRDRRAGTLPEDDYRRGLLALAEFADRHRAQRDEYAALARRLYGQLVGTPMAPDDLHFRLGRLFEEQEPADDETRRRALAQYEAHLKRFPGDADALAAVERLRALLIPVAETPPPAENAESETPAAATREGFERQNWAWMLDGVDPTPEMRAVLAASVVRNRLDHDNQMLRLPYMPLPNKDKVIYQLNATRGGDYADKTALTFLAYLQRDVPGVGVAVALSTGNYEWYESQPIRLPSTSRYEPRTLKFNLKETRWKSRKTNWRNTSAVEDLDRVRAIYILIYNPEDKGELVLDAIQFE